MKKDFYYQLPEGYVADKTIDAKEIKFGVLLNIAAAVIMIASYIIVDLIVAGRITFQEAFFSVFEPEKEKVAEFIFRAFLPIIIILPSMVIYVILHELLHGAAYKILTRAKLSFGITWSAAYCGVPNIYVGKKTAFFALLTPFSVFNVIFIVLIVLTKTAPLGILPRIMFAMHLGGCAGDLYVTALLIFKYRGDVLTQDEGTKQTFYARK